MRLKPLTKAIANKDNVSYTALTILVNKGVPRMPVVLLLIAYVIK